jgi:uncharacterized protein YbaA (DUF1428 family)
MPYVDGYLIVVPKRKLKAYESMAKLGERMWRDHGALDYKECVLDDASSMSGTPFPKLAGAKKTDTVVFSYVVYANRAQRDKVNAKVMKDPRMGSFDPKKMPFDMTKMSYGGFKVLVGGGAKRGR